MGCSIMRYCVMHSCLRQTARQWNVLLRTGPPKFGYFYTKTCRAPRAPKKKNPIHDFWW